MHNSLIIIPTYNEIENIDRMIETIFSISKETNILVVDDSSPDNTSSLVKELQKKYEDKLFLLERKQKRGLGTAYIEGFKWGLKKSYDYFFQIDCDFSHNPNDLKRLYLELLENNVDLCIGSRYISGINVVNWPLSRVLLSYFASFYVRFITGMQIKDPTAGYKLYRRQVLEAIPLDNVEFVGYAFQIEMKFRTWKKKFKIIEIPIVFKDREKGVSKLNSGIIKEAVFGVLKMKIKSIFSSGYK
ncbi:MAG: dolichyl-phosphate beta-D-mannosyltransferase [Flavobacteriales bacterium]|jgi:dolichol-phosphate mannosyltransferase|nr:dolichyl-phosphate beta-D-mannosyltransferase [Flavobacteriales bacterium]|tara:strand:+ start:54395 stop:55126 length:732 start_codon:yes stop_codon:yes gene_type:complete